MNHDGLIVGGVDDDDRGTEPGAPYILCGSDY
jgi:hypothetical protein